MLSSTLITLLLRDSALRLATLLQWYPLHPFTLLHPKPYTLRPYTLKPTPYTVHPTESSHSQILALA